MHRTIEHGVDRWMDGWSGKRKLVNNYTLQFKFKLIHMQNKIILKGREITAKDWRHDNF
jgi:allantoicase